MPRKRTRPNEYEIAILQDICEQNDCTMDVLFEALTKNIVREQLSDQIHFQKTGELPK
ncbi:MAG TPA: hypothetical protein VHO70_19880 [Chitinispirillaceae bacterium]|nr:hypothetical protein [Chitinispirillaceae bacterium]